MPRTHACEPTLTDTEVLEFCKNGFMMLPGIIPGDINRRTLDFIEADPLGASTRLLADEEWFVDAIILHPQVAGAVRSLLGNNFGLPVAMANHRVVCPGNGQHWHVDDGSEHGPELNYLQVFYFPQACPKELGPTELLPGSHHLTSSGSLMGHYSSVRGSYHAVSPEGSIFITVYSVYHRRSRSMASGVRSLLKYNYWRTEPPQRDWIIDPDFDLATADYKMDGPFLQTQAQNTNSNAKMFLWLCGKSFSNIGGQGWPNYMAPGTTLDRPYGVPLDI